MSRFAWLASPFLVLPEQTHQVLSEAKSRLEGCMLEGSTSDVVKGVTYIQVWHGVKSCIQLARVWCDMRGCIVFCSVHPDTCQARAHLLSYLVAAYSLWRDTPHVGLIEEANRSSRVLDVASFMW